MKRLFLLAPMAALSLAAAAAHGADFTVSTHSQVNGSFPNAQFASGWGCTGKDMSPDIAWKNAPQGTKSYVVTVYDPDAPTGSGWWHWAVANIPAGVTELKEGAGSAGGVMPPGSLAVRGDNGMPGYGGICPPEGQTHKYVITVHALKVERLDLPATATPALLGFMTSGASLGKASVTVKGGR